MLKPALTRRLSRWLSGMAKGLSVKSAVGSKQSSTKRVSCVGLGLEILEDRCVPAVVALDGTFGTGGKATNIGFGAGNDAALNMVQQPDGNSVLVGLAQVGAQIEFAVERLTTSGTLDTTFGGSGTGQTTFAFGLTNDQAFGVTLDSSGNIIVVGFTQQGANFAMAVARLTSAGVLDTNFGVLGKRTISFGGTDDDAISVAMQGTNIVVAGRTNVSGNQDFAVARLTSAGILDTSFGVLGLRTVSFNLGGTNDDAVDGIAIDGGSRIVVTGYAATAGGGNDFAIARLTANANVGTGLDTTFNTTGKTNFHFTGTGNLDNEATNVVLTASGQIVVAGFAQVNGTETDFAVARLNSNGTLDTSSTNPTTKPAGGVGLNGTGKALVSFGNVVAEANAVYIQPDSRIVVGGFAGNVSGNQDFAITRLNADGTLDTSFGTFTIGFNLGSSNNDNALAMSLGKNGAVTMAGSADTAASGENFVALRLTVGSLDVDGNGIADPLTDGILILRFLFTFTGTALTSGALAQNATRTNPVDIVNFLTPLKTSMLDADGSGSAGALTDGILILRYLFNFTGTALTSGAITPGAPNSTPAGVISFLDQFNPGIHHEFADSAGPGVPESELLTDAQLQATTTEAIALWEQSGITAQQQALLQSAVVVAGNIGGLGLGQTHGNVVLIDRSAAGWGWYADPSGSNAAFQTQITDSELQALPGSAAFGKMDLLTVVMHELGLVMGFADLNPAVAPYSIMSEVLSAGIRRLPA